MPRGGNFNGEGFIFLLEKEARRGAAHGIEALCRSFDGSMLFDEDNDMSELARAKCLSCRSDAPKITDSEMAGLIAQIPQWQVVERQGIRRLERAFRFANFADALAFTIRVGALAESEAHHPAILTEWGRATVTWWTHAIRGLHRNDFIMAAKTDALFEALGRATT